MKKNVVFAAFIPLLFVIIPLAHATQQTSFEWAGEFHTPAPTGTQADNPAYFQSSQWFSTVAACQADLAAFETKRTGTLSCTCDQAIYLQPNCPDYATANAAVAGQIPLYGACQQSSQCAANLTCGSNKICVSGNPASSAGLSSPNPAQGVTCTSSIDGTTVTCPDGYTCDTSYGVCNPPTTGTVSSPGNPAGTVSPPGKVTAQPSSNIGQNVQLINPLSGSCSAGGDCLLTFLKSILSLVTRVGTIAIILMLVYIGFLFATTSVNPGNKEKAKEYLLWTIIGALVILGAQAIANGISATVQALSTGS